MIEEKSIAQLRQYQEDFDCARERLLESHRTKQINMQEKLKAAFMDRSDAMDKMKFMEEKFQKNLETANEKCRQMEKEVQTLRHVLVPTLY